MFVIKSGKQYFKKVSPTVYVENIEDKIDTKESTKEEYENILKRTKCKKRRDYRPFIKDLINGLKSDLKELKKSKPERDVDFSKPIHTFVESIDEAKVFKTKKQAEETVGHLIKKYGKVSNNFKIVKLEKDK